MTSSIKAYGTLLKRGDGGTPEAFTTLAEVRDISGPELSLDTVDVTSHSSSNGWEEHVATILRSGEVTFDINYVPSGSDHDASTGIIADMTSRTLRNWQLVFPDSGSTTWNFAAYVTGFSPNAPVAGELTASVTLKVSGEPTLA